MRNIESLSSITSQDFTQKISHFPEGKIFRQGDNMVFIYDNSGKRRWEIQDYVNNSEKRHTMKVGLYAQLGVKNWHTLIEASEVRHTKRNKEMSVGIGIDVLNETDSFGDALTTVDRMHFNTTRNGEITKQWSTAHHGRKSDIEKDLNVYTNLARTKDQLPFKIDIHETVQNVIAAFSEGQFEPPQLILPKDKKELSIPKLAIPKLIYKK